MDEVCLELVLGSLAPWELATCVAVCRQWQHVAQRPHVRSASLVREWRVAGAVHVHEQRAWSHLLSLRAPREFYLKHAVQPGDTLSALSVRHGVPVAEIRRLNNLMSDAISCRAHLYLPAFTHVEQLEGRELTYEYDALSKRPLAIVAHEQSQPAVVAAPSAEAVAARRAKLASLLARSLRIDEASAGFYLDEAGGNVRDALAHARRDAQWAQAEGAAAAARAWLG